MHDNDPFLRVRLLHSSFDDCIEVSNIEKIDLRKLQLYFAQHWETFHLSYVRCKRFRLMILEPVFAPDFEFYHIREGRKEMERNRGERREGGENGKGRQKEGKEKEGVGKKREEKGGYGRRNESEKTRKGERIERGKKANEDYSPYYIQKKRREEKEGRRKKPDRVRGEEKGEKEGEEEGKGEWGIGTGNRDRTEEKKEIMKEKRSEGNRKRRKREELGKGRGKE
ncbi:hypothetical protein Tco_1080664 [Tanacetum coccineum]|uniref:Uncharacterized protein n=1 Tax=Tanacetum coccineum TaxID=301880 RepID=A0ABQ5HW82_9ASTR